MKNSKKCKFTAALDSIPLEKTHSASYRRKTRSIKSYISLNSVESNIFWWNGLGIADHYICCFVKIKLDCIYLSYLKRKFLSPTLLSEIVYSAYATHNLNELWMSAINLHFWNYQKTVDLQFQSFLKWSFHKKRRTQHIAVRSFLMFKDIPIYFKLRQWI